jgi:hypothetical protein
LMAPFQMEPAGRTGRIASEAEPDDRYWWHDPHWVEASRHACCSDD